MKARLQVRFVAFAWSVLAWTTHSLDVVVDLPQNIRHDVEEFILLTVFGARRDISLELLVFSNDITFYRQEIIRQIENDQNTFQIPFKVAPTFENCHQPSPVNSDLLCPVILSIEIKEGATSIWRNTTEANLLKTPGKIFIQTNKPIYFPGDEVLVRFLALDHELLSVRRVAHLSIQSPEIGENRMIAWERKITFRKQPYVRKIVLPEDALVGSWKICASYTRNTVAEAREESFFTVSYATTPSFKITIQYEGRDFILPGDDTFALRITARTVFGEPINGNAFVSFGLVRSDNEDFLKFTHIVKNLKLLNGEYFLAVDLNHLMGDEDWTTLPVMRLVVLSSVTEYGSGETQTIRDDSVIFSTEPYIITYIDGEDSFQPGIIVIANVKLTYPNGSAVQQVEVDIRFTSMSGAQEEVMFYERTSETCSLGTVTLRAESPTGMQAIEIISTSKYRGQNSVEYIVTKTKVLRAQDETNAEYVHIIAPQEVLHVHSSSVIQVYAAPSSVLKQIHYSVTKKGRLILNRSTTISVGENDVLIELPISPSMSPYVIFTAYYFAQDSHQLVSDRAVIYVEQSCSGEKAAIFTTSDGNGQPTTDVAVNFEVTGEPSSLISITGFDAALKSLSPKFNQEISEIISRQSISSTSLLCDNGRIFTGTFVQNSAKYCVGGGIRTKRSITDQSIDESVVNTALQFKGALFECCIVGARDISSVINSARSCEERLEFVVEASCRQTFLRCCKLAECLQRFGNDTDFCSLNFEQGDISSRTVSTTFMPFTPAMKTMFLLEKNIEFQRKDFSSTWFFIDFKMGASGRKFLDASSTPKIPAIPDSITKWNIDIFSTSPDTSLCFGNEVQIPIQHYVYTKVRLPKAAVIIGTLVAAEVTTYNHLGTSVETHLYLSGEEGICGGNNFGENSEPIRHTLQPSRNNVPSSNTIIFSMLPLRAGDLKIKIKLLWHRQGDLRENLDEVVEMLKVIPAGTRKKGVKWILVDTRHPGFAIRRKTTREKALPISNDATPDAVELKASVHSTLSALLTPPDLSSIDPTSINYQLYRLNSNLLRLKYYEGSTSVGPKATDNILEEIQDSYFSLLGYVRPARHSSEIPQRFAFSYSPARMSQPSLKLTSSVVSLLYRTAEKGNVDMTLLRGSLYWILDQQKRQGYFYEASQVVASEDERNGVKVKISRKRSVVMSITESKIYLTGNILTNLAIIKTMAKTNSLLRKGVSDADLAVIERAISMGQSYLKKRTRKVASASRCRSTIALTAAAHALQLTGNRVDTSILAAIRRWKAEGSSDAGEIWWIQNCLPDFFEPQTDQYEADADTIEATARMLSVEILLGYTPDRYVNWLISKRNAGNYWTSLQASLVAMDSLGRYALLNQGRESIDIEIEDAIFGNYSFKYSSKDVPLSPVKSRVRYHTTGEGRAWIKIVSSYHYSVTDDQRTNKVGTRDRSARSETSFCIYNVDIAMTEDTPREVEERSAQPRFAWKMSISVQIRQDVIGDQYQSYVLDAKLPAGSNVIESDLSKLFNPVEHVLDHYRITSRSVLFYMTGNKSISFRITHSIMQREPIPFKIYPVSVPELACRKFYNFPGFPATIQTFCATRNVSSSDVCVCANANACPQYYRQKHSTRITLEKRIARTCGKYSTFAYKVFLQKRKDVDSFWWKYEGQIVSVYRSTGFEDIQTDIDHSFWMKRSCNKIPLKRNYLIMGKTVLASNDGRYKHLMDKNSWVEFWPQNPDDCGETTSKLCISSQKLDEYEYTIRRRPCGLS